MKLTREQKDSIAKSKNISDIIGSKLKENDGKRENKIDLTKIAKDLSERRQNVLKEEN